MCRENGGTATRRVALTSKRRKSKSGNRFGRKAAAKHVAPARDRKLDEHNDASDRIDGGSRNLADRNRFRRWAARREWQFRNASAEFEFVLV